MKDLERLKMLESIKLNEWGLTPRDMETIRLMAEFGGKTYLPVLRRSLYFGVADQTIRNKMQKLRTKKKLILTKPTGLTNPRTAYVLSSSGKDFALEVFDKRIGEVSVSPVTTNHTIQEQIAFFYLWALGREVERATVAKWRERGLSHSPDLCYTNKKGALVYVEIENTRKRPQRLVEIFNKMEKDGAGAVLYVFEDEHKMRILGRNLPIWEKIRVTTLDWLAEGVREEGRLKAISQSKMLEMIRAFNQKKKDRRFKDAEQIKFKMPEEV